MPSLVGSEMCIRDRAETTLREVEWSASRTGLINPVAIFDPVELEGTTVSRASVHNVSIVKELKLGIGDRITVYKACLLYTSDAADDLLCVDLGGRRIIKKKKKLPLEG